MKKTTSSGSTNTRIELWPCPECGRFNEGYECAGDLLCLCLACAEWYFGD